MHSNHPIDRTRVVRSRGNPRGRLLAGTTGRQRLDGNRPSPLRSSRHRRGATLLDVALGSMLLSVLLIPSVHLIGKSESSNRRLALRDVLLYEADQLMESTKVSLADQNAYNAALARPIDVRQGVVTTDAVNLFSRVRVAADTSIPSANLLTVLVEVWQDQDRDRQLDANEPSESFRSQWASP